MAAADLVVFAQRVVETLGGDPQLQGRLDKDYEPLDQRFRP